MSENSGYYHKPTIHGDKIVFVAEDDLWMVTTQGGIAHRLTTTQGLVTHPAFSPNGKWVAFTSTEEGSSDVYVIPSEGGPVRRLTYLGNLNYVISWSPDSKKIYFSSNARAHDRRYFELLEISVEGGEPKKVPIGPARHYHEIAGGRSVIGRFQEDNARWKRYRGGQAGDIWIDANGDGNFQRLIRLQGNLVRPWWVKGDRIVFLSDHEGVSNIYSVNPDGSDLKKLTNHQDYYARFLSTDGNTLVYQCGAEIWILDLNEGEPRPKKVPITIISPRTQRQRKFVNPREYLEDAVLGANGTHLFVVVRGKPYYFAFWEGGVKQLGKPQGVRYIAPAPLPDKERVALISDETGKEIVEIHYLNQLKDPKKFPELDLGIVFRMKASPDGKRVAISNNRQELLVLSIDDGKITKVDKSDYRPIWNFDWSPDGKWLSYGTWVTDHASIIRLYDVESSSTHDVTKPDFQDDFPVFDPKGRYLYFLSRRHFSPTFDAHFFQYDFIKGTLLCAVTLQKDQPSPFIPKPKPLDKMFKKPTPSENNGNKRGNDENGNGNNNMETQELQPVAIDLEGITDRVEAFPIPAGDYRHLAATRDKVFFSEFPVKTFDERQRDGEPIPDGMLKAFDLEALDAYVVMKGISSFSLGFDRKTLLVRSGKDLRVLSVKHREQGGPLGSKGSPAAQVEANKKPSRKTGWIDLNRVKVMVNPPDEWEQMLKETWRLMKENYWLPSLRGIDWNAVLEKYLKVLPKVTTRSEFSDLVWEMQGELGTSHAYEFGGDYRKPPMYRQGFLGAEFEYEESLNGYKIISILRGDDWDSKTGSPLAKPGLDVKEGDVILAVNGQRVSRTRSIHELLMNQANQYVDLTVVNADGTSERTITVKTIPTEMPLRYRAWVERNRRKVHNATNGRVGYLHIPDMQVSGMKEFARYLRIESEKDGLIVDVRFNGGGHTSELILERLSRKLRGYSKPRHGVLRPEPTYSVKGALVAITNEHAGSDGDIFSHSFKMLKLGPLIGTRTWGGVIGIWPKRRLVDGSIVTQPEYSFWFFDVEWGVENYGTDPDIEVEITPQDYREDKDTQLEKALEIILEKLKDFQQKFPEIPT